MVNEVEQIMQDRPGGGYIVVAEHFKNIEVFIQYCFNSVGDRDGRGQSHRFVAMQNLRRLDSHVGSTDVGTHPLWKMLECWCQLLKQFGIHVRSREDDMTDRSRSVLLIGEALEKPD